MSLNGKTILLCVTGGIAAFKSAALTSQLTQKGADVKVLMTSNAKKFITPLTFQALSRQPVYDDTFEEKDSESIAHIDLADEADLILVVPATANMIGKIANGIADDIVSTTILATKAPVWIAPAMNVNMYGHPAVQKNLQQLINYGFRLIEPGEGQLACGWVGKGRLVEPEEVLTIMENYFSENMVTKPLKNKKVLITAGPTQERVDPVRYFTNRSSGKMGYALAEAAAGLGADVMLVSGPTQLQPPVGVTKVDVVTAQQMYDEVMKYFGDSDLVVKAAAVADYRPAKIYTDKLKKQQGDWHVEMERTDDILAALGHQKQQQILVGFAAETENIEATALEKLERKKLDMVVANDISNDNSGFQSDTNIVTVYKRDGSKRELAQMPKQQIAEEIFIEIRSLLKGFGE